MTRAAVLGAGSWGTAFSKVLADAGCQVSLWARRAEIAEAIAATRHNPEYLSDIALPDRVFATADSARALAGADVVVIAVPSQTLRDNLTGWRADIPAAATLLSLMKGVELGTSERMSEVIRDVAGVDESRVAVLTGPNLAREIALEQPAAAVVACLHPGRATTVQLACTTPYFRPYTNPDVVGCELGGAVKNVIALASGMVEGMGFGDNTKASLMTRGLAETSRLGVALGADPMTFAGLAGLGDLVATCSSPLSRNRCFGERLGRGDTVAQAAAATTQTAEGVESCRSILDLARTCGIDMPITEQVVRVCHDGLSPVVAVKILMGRETRSE